MSFKRKLQVYTMAAALGLGVTAAGTTAVQAESNASQRLVEALKALKVDNVEYLYSYLQTAKITDSEVNAILANADRAKEMLNGKADASALTGAQKTELLRLFVETAQLAHLQVSLVDAEGNALDLANLDLSNGLQIQLLDPSGTLLGTMDPTPEDIQPQNLETLFTALETAVAAKVELNKTGTYVPVENGELPATNSQDPTYLAIGALILALGAALTVPAVRTVRKMEQA